LGAPGASLIPWVIGISRGAISQWQCRDSSSVIAISPGEHVPPRVKKGPLSCSLSNGHLAPGAQEAASRWLSVWASKCAEYLVLCSAMHYSRVVQCYALVVQVVIFQLGWFCSHDAFAVSAAGARLLQDLVEQMKATNRYICQYSSTVLVSVFASLILHIRAHMSSRTECKHQKELACTSTS
jgi:hypothetical protein